MQRALAADACQAEKKRKPSIASRPFPDSGLLFQPQRPTSPGVELDLVELGSLIELTSVPARGGFDQIGQAFDEGGYVSQGRDPDEFLKSSFRSRSPRDSCRFSTQGFMARSTKLIGITTSSLTPSRTKGGPGLRRYRLEATPPDHPA